MDQHAQTNLKFQTIVLQCTDPETGDQLRHQFVGQALFTQDQLRRWKLKGVSASIEIVSIEPPYNPYEDTDNAEVHRHMTDLARKIIQKEEQSGDKI